MIVLSYRTLALIYDFMGSLNIAVQMFILVKGIMHTSRNMSKVSICIGCPRIILLRIIHENIPGIQ